MAIHASVVLPGPAALALALRGMVAVDLAEIRAGVVPGNLYAAGVVYRREPPGVDRWQCASQVLASGAGDCEDLTPWFCAWRQSVGDTGWLPHAYRSRPGVIHVVARQGARIEDPSKKLGMGAI